MEKVPNPFSLVPFFSPDLFFPMASRDDIKPRYRLQDHANTGLINFALFTWGGGERETLYHFPTAEIQTIDRTDTTGVCVGIAFV